MMMSEFPSAALRISNYNNSWSEEYYQCYPVYGTVITAQNLSKARVIMMPCGMRNFSSATLCMRYHGNCGELVT